MNPDILRTIEREYEQKRTIAEKNTEYLKNETYEKNPKLAEIDRLIKKLGIEASKTTLVANEKDKEQILKDLTEKIEALKKEKQSILNECGVSLKPNYECDKCKDTGYITIDLKTQMCTCMKQKLINESYNKSNLYRLKNDTFENFNESLYDEKTNIEKYGINISPKENITKIKGLCLDFIENFESAEQKNLLFTGTPGVGKTFLSGCIANEILKKGYTVLYQTSPLLLDSIFEYKFNQKNASSKELYDSLFNVNLLIIDDLGTENLTAARFAELFTVINARLLNPRTKTIISTNLSLENLAKTYDCRVLSRLIGNFNICRFIGDDIRLK
ncbi:MAG: ATP-binding protein [Clostridia bacterium]|nr:ATP-binding protein [Clostridia bacterium]